jgi:hypothetical protein
MYAIPYLIMAQRRDGTTRGAREDRSGFYVPARFPTFNNVLTAALNKAEENQRRSERMSGT